MKDLLWILLLLCFFPDAKSDCTNLKVDATYTLAGHFSANCSVNIVVRNHIIIGQNFNCKGTSSQNFENMFNKFVINGGDVNCPENLQPCSLPDGKASVFLRYVFKFAVDNTNMTSFPLLAIVDNGYISLARNGIVLTNNAIYRGTQKVQSRKDMKVTFSRQCVGIVDVASPSRRESSCIVFQNSYKVLNKGVQAFQATTTINLGAREITATTQINQSSLKFVEYQYNYLEKFTSIKLSPGPKKFFFNILYKTDDGAPHKILVGNFILRNSMTMWPEGSQFNAANRCSNITTNVDVLTTESSFCCQRYQNSWRDEF